MRGIHIKKMFISFIINYYYTLPKNEDQQLPILVTINQLYNINFD